MNDDDDFILDHDDSIGVHCERIGWEVVVFEIADENESGE